ncbi:MAG: YkgJ family cysteine cluster protein [Planctomycetaceae bacterium]|nr:YkgJ family cysteine cluster protein [Planctomycetaceae bacterium]
MTVALPILVLPVAAQRYSCHGCGNCCRDFTVQLRDADLAKLEAQKWEERLGERVTVEFRGRRYLRQRADGACVFLMDDGLCRVHKEFGFAEKPVACQLFPFVLAPDDAKTHVGISFACQSVRENKGAELRSHLSEVDRMSRALPETRLATHRPFLADAMAAGDGELDALAQICDRFLARTDVTLRDRFDGLAWLAASLGKAKLAEVRAKRFSELLTLLAAALPAELEHLPVEPALPKQVRMLRQAVYARLEDVQVNDAKSRGRLRTVLAQLLSSRAFSRGKGRVPAIARGLLAGTDFRTIDAIPPLSESPDHEAIDALLSRYARATILGGRAWGAGYYGWPALRGLQALVLNIACTAWTARALAASRGHAHATLDDVRDALGRIDRHAGRAPWLGSVGERLRLEYFRLDDGLRRVVRAGI